LKRNLNWHFLVIGTVRGIVTYLHLYKIT